MLYVILPLIQCFGNLLNNPSLHRSLRPIDFDPKSGSTYQAIKSWIGKCDSTHKACLGHVKSPLLTRVIDVGPVDGSRGPRLYISNGGCGSYIELRYYWGSTNPAVMTRQSLKDHIREIAFSGLPRTIQDLISITRRLGVQFLWVDALCIVQDSISGEDWIHESSKMATIYGNAYLTIAAEVANVVTKNIIVFPSMDDFCLS
jgi:hypothetical protein